MPIDEIVVKIIRKYNYRNRLEVPSAEQAFGNDECQEIIEEYDEQTELKWRERHKASVREHKSKEALERQQIRTEINDVEIWDKLEHNEMMEELENEMEDLDEDAAEQMNLIDSMLNLQLADTNNTANIECSNIDEIETEQFNDLRKEAEHLSNTDKIKFYEKHLLDLDERLATKSSHDSDELAEMHVTEGCLREAIAEIQEEINTDSSDGSDCLDNSYTSDESDASGDDRSFYCDSKNDEQRIGKYMASSPDSPKCKSVIEFASVEAEYDKLNKTKSELLIFYKSQLRYVNKIDKNISAESNEEGGISLVEFVLNRIDELRVDILQEKQKKVEEDFVDDDDNIFKKPSKCRQFYLDRLRDADGYNMANDEDGGKRRIKFAAEPEITTFDKEDEPFRIQNESNRESFSEFIDKKFEFFTSPMNEEYESESFDCNKTVDVGTMMAESSGSVDTEDNVVVNSTDNNNVDKCEIEVNRPDDLMQGSSEESLLLPPLIIEFEHSTAQECHTDASSENDFLDSPVDIYKMFGGGSPPKETLRHECDEEPAHMVFLKKYIANRDCHGKTQENTQAQTANTETDKAVDAERAAPIFEAAIPNANVQPGRSILKKRKTEPEHEACHEVPEYKQDNGESMFIFSNIFCAEIELLEFMLRIIFYIFALNFMSRTSTTKKQSIPRVHRSKLHTLWLRFRMR